MPLDEQPVKAFELLKLPWDIFEHVVGHLDRIAYKSLPLCSREVREKVNPILFRKIALPKRKAYGHWEGDMDGRAPQLPPPDVLPLVRSAHFRVDIVDISKYGLAGVRTALSHQSSLMPGLTGLTEYKLDIEIYAQREYPLERPVEDLVAVLGALRPTSAAVRVKVQLRIHNGEVVPQVLPALLRKAATLPWFELAIDCWDAVQGTENLEGIRQSIGLCGRSIRTLRLRSSAFHLMPSRMGTPLLERLVCLEPYPKCRVVPVSQARLGEFVAECIATANGQLQTLHLDLPIAFEGLYSALAIPTTLTVPSNALREVTCSPDGLRLLSQAFNELPCRKLHLTIKEEGDFRHLRDLLLQRSSLPALNQLHLHVENVTFESDVVHLQYPCIRKLAFGRGTSLSIRLSGYVHTKERLEPTLEAICCLARELTTLDLVFGFVMDLDPLYTCLKGTRLPACARLAIRDVTYEHFEASFVAAYVRNLVAPNLRIIDVQLGSKNCDFLEEIEQLLRQHAWPRLCCIQGTYWLVQGEGEVGCEGASDRERWEGFCRTCDQRGIDITGLEFRDCR